MGNRTKTRGKREKEKANRAIRSSYISQNKSIFCLVEIRNKKVQHELKASEASLEQLKQFGLQQSRKFHDSVEKFHYPSKTRGKREKEKANRTIRSSYFSQNKSIFCLVEIRN